ncbi:MAG: GAF domain-containing protein [Candidatus Eisenbacteria bacterium]|nr:GAF domain-containing protein [Candidatus Eisenbacteria bacterium]
MNLPTVLAEIDKMDARGLDLEEILEATMQLLSEVNPLFHWTGIYEVFPDDVLRLGPFVGAPTDHVFISVGRGVCGRAVAERRNMNIPDVRRESNYLACSTQTRSELVVLIRLGEMIYAQIDIDSHQLAAFDDEAVALVQGVADRLALVYSARRSNRSNLGAA